MNIRYYHEFIGADDTLNRFEILTKSNVQSILAEASAEPFSIEYVNAKKFEPVRGSQATVEFISKSIFQFVDLHTDDMQKFLVKFYRAGRLYWLGWLDSELYNEQLSATPPYSVEFAASDFNILERLKYRDAAGNRYTDIVPLITHLKRCFDLLNLPFDKLYIGCTTVANDVLATAGETALHVLYMMSSNFYDEDREPMTCREVVENILRPFGLMMVQKDANVFIYDYNTVKLGLPMRRYNFSSFTYEAEEMVNFDLGALAEIGFRSTDSSYGFEEMINNVKITSSLYGSNPIYKEDIKKKTLSDRGSIVEDSKYKKELFLKDEHIENLMMKGFVLYTEKDTENTLIGAESLYNSKPTITTPLFRVKTDNFLVGTGIQPSFNLNVKVDIYVNTRDNPFDTEQKDSYVERAKSISLFCNLYITDTSGKPIRYYDNRNMASIGWWTCPADGTVKQGQFELFYCAHNVDAGNMLNSWHSNTNLLHVRNIWGAFPKEIPERLIGKGVNVPLVELGAVGGEIVGVGVAGYIVLEITDEVQIMDPAVSTWEPYPENLVKNILLNKFSFSIVDQDGENAPTDDYEFKSHVNKKVATDFEEITLKCISANEEKAPIGKANILKKIDNHYELQLSFTRNSQTDILERLLMCSLHSNFATKKEVITVDIKMTDNPALSYVSYRPILSDDYLVTGCKLNFARAISTLTASGFSADDAQISDIPYD